MSTLVKQVVAVLICALGICLATATTCLATGWWTATDEHPRQIAPNAWVFSIKLPVKPMGNLQFVGSSYLFASRTQYIAVDYKFDRTGIDYYFEYPGGFLGIGPALFNLDPMDPGFKNGWNITDLKDGTFSGVVYATAPLTVVSFQIEADYLMPR